MNACHSFLRLLSGLVFCAALGSGCSRTTLTNQALDFNKTVQQHRLDSLFLNVVRAAHREPMAMTSINLLSTTNQASAGGILGLDFGPLSRLPYNAKIDARVSHAPRLDLLILDNDDEFVRGFMKSVDNETIAYFLHQGWNPKMLAYLLIESLDGQYEDYGPVERAEISRHSGGRSPAHVTISNQPDNPLFDYMIEKHLPNLQLSENGFRIVKSTVRVHTRSPQGILYYLGELARVSLGEEPGKIPEIDGKPLFLVRQGPRPSLESPVSVDFRGHFYHVPTDPPSRSLSALSLVQQLVNLQTKKVQPATSTIQLIGG